MALKICGFIVEVVVAPPALYLKQVVSDVTKNVAVSAQNCYKASKGAFTGEIRYVEGVSKCMSLLQLSLGKN